MLQGSVLLHTGPEPRLPHQREGRSQNPARPRPPPGKIPPPSPVHHSDPHWPRLARLRSPPGSLPSHPVLAVRWVRDLPSGLFLGCPLRPWLPGQPAFLHWVSFPWGRYPGHWPALPWDRLLPTPPCPIPRALCLGGGAGDQQHVLFKGCADGGRRDACLLSGAARSGAARSGACLCP